MAQAVEMTATCAGGLETGPEPEVSPLSVSALLAHRVLPHVAADVELAGAGSAGEAWGERLGREQLELARSIEELGMLLLDVDRWQRHRGLRRRIARTLRRLAEALVRHQDTDRSLWASLCASAATDSELAALLDRSDAAERRAAAGLRFLWHPPIPDTEVKALRMNPRFSRVLVLDEPAAASLDSPSGADLDGRSEALTRVP
ncbi:MAG: hypothetical protein ACREQM_16520 [Candidatus Dormibacteraceae bacterium]